MACKDNVFPQKAIILEIQNGIWQKQYQKQEIVQKLYFTDKVADNLNAGKNQQSEILYFLFHKYPKTKRGAGNASAPIKFC